ncbi:hypothetical protein HOLleu_04401 [Holothuria leucospilota]|uniref:Uncharacterized protein n=1 Tax=Holothuria leucospilota TaxID=206669 RepID=A0A9Q1HMC8_HOLLE|nr:hypothetical protein HOLleu_04401 [Holothuria leucospilota]
MSSICRNTFAQRVTLKYAQNVPSTFTNRKSVTSSGWKIFPRRSCRDVISSRQS